MRSYHAILEEGRIVSEEGERTLLERFASQGTARGLAPFERRRAGAAFDGARPGPLEIVAPLLEQTITDLLAARHGRPRRPLADATRIERDGGGFGAGSAVRSNGR